LNRKSPWAQRGIFGQLQPLAGELQPSFLIDRVVRLLSRLAAFLCLPAEPICITLGHGEALSVSKGARHPAYCDYRPRIAIDIMTVEKMLRAIMARSNASSALMPLPQVVAGVRSILVVEFKQSQLAYATSDHSRAGVRL